MNKIITYGTCVASVSIGGDHAVIVTTDNELPAALADVLDDTDNISVDEIFKCDARHSGIRLSHDLSSAELLTEVCDAITCVYDTDTVVSKGFCD